MTGSTVTTLLLLALPLALTPAWGAEREVKVGAIYPLTGSAASAGRDAKAGVELALSIINARHDLDLPLARSEGLPRLGGAKLRYIFGDHQGKPDVGQAEAERLITQEKVVALQGAYHSSVVATASQVAERFGTPFFCDIATSPTLHQRGFKWFFRTSPHDGTFAENFFKFLEELRQRRHLKIEDVAIVTENTLYGSDVAKFDRQFATQYGYRVVADIAYKAGAPDLSSETLKIKAADPDVVFHAAYTSDAILFVKTYKQFDFAPRAILAHGSGFLDTAFRQTLGPDANYIFSWEIWADDIGAKRPLVGAVSELFKRRFGFQMNGHSARSFVGTLVLADAINRAGSTDPETIRRALLATDLPGERLITPWPGVRFDPNTGQNVLASGIIVQVQDRAFRTVWPKAFASAEPIWPMPKWKDRR